MAATGAKKAYEFRTFVRQSGLQYTEPELGGIKGFDDEEQAKAMVNDKNDRAQKMGLKARYEVVKGTG